MTFANAVNGSNLDFQNTSGTMEWATRDRFVYGRAENIGIAYSGSTFTIQGADGTALSATNPAYVTLPSKTAGRLKRIKVTANQTFVDSTGSSTIIGNLFGLTTGIAYALDLPFFIYAVINDSENAISFMISRIPNTQVSPASGSIGKTGSAVADTQGAFFALGNPTVADYDTNPCVSIGSFRMQMNASDDWAVTALTITNSGIGIFQEQVNFGMTTGQFGAASGKYFLNNGGTAPAFSNNPIAWSLTKNNQLNFFAAFSNCGTAGVGAVAAKFALPYKITGGFGPLYVVNGTPQTFAGNYLADSSSATNTNTFSITNDAGTVNPLLNNQITVAAGYVVQFNLMGYIDLA